MGIALFSFSSVLAQMSTWVNKTPAKVACSRPALRIQRRVTPQAWARNTVIGGSNTGGSDDLALSNNHAKPQPLRVVRLSEAGTITESAGRMRISGRMADVCAEIDRLAAKEAQILSH
jgi:hypothetical protein